MMVDGVEYDKEMEFLIVKLSPKQKLKLVKGRHYTLSMSFVGNLTDQLKGLYRSSYQEDGVEKYVDNKRHDILFLITVHDCNEFEICCYFTFVIDFWPSLKWSRQMLDELFPVSTNPI